MCGRYTLTEADPHRIATRFDFDEHGIDRGALGRFNICPTETVQIVTGEGPRVVRWGLVPAWKRSAAAGPLLINARAETAATRAPFASLLARPERRCLVPADGWYEWLAPEAPKAARTPIRYTVDGGAPFAFAGLWCVAKIDGEWLASATILTTAANAICRPVHDRMPCVLADRDAEAAWLAPAVDAAAALDLLAPLADARCAAAPANPAVNRAGVEGPELLTPPTGTRRLESPPREGPDPDAESGDEPEQLSLV